MHFNGDVDDDYDDLHNSENPKRDQNSTQP